MFYQYFVRKLRLDQETAKFKLFSEVFRVDEVFKFSCDIVPSLLVFRNDETAVVLKGVFCGRLHLHSRGDVIIDLFYVFADRFQVVGFYHVIKFLLFSVGNRTFFAVFFTLAFKKVIYSISFYEHIFIDRSEAAAFAVA